MKTVKVRNIELGSGIPKICVPIVAVTKNDILEQAISLRSIPADIAEWRVDWYEDVFQMDTLIQTLSQVREALGDMPLLFTFRTKKEGGEKEISPESYAELNIAAAASGNTDLVDVEAFTGDEIVRKIIEKAHEHGVKVVASNHDFFKTPPKEEIISRLVKMQDLGADIPKIAVMPQSKKDVLTLLSATEEMYSQHADRPIITMSMAGSGLISRLSGEVFGSALTFGAAKQASAPGQIGVKELHEVLSIIHSGI